jgi:maleate cis-trans isomerase
VIAPQSRQDRETTVDLMSCWRGTVGLIKPNYRPGSTEDLIRMLPEGIGIVPVHIDIDQGTRKQFEASIPDYEKWVAKLTELGVDIIHPAGSPPFQILGYDGEQELMKQWEKKYKRPCFTNGMTQVNAFRALKVRSLVGVSYFPAELNASFGEYFRQAGLEVLAMEGVGVDFQKVQTLASTEIYRFIKKIFLANPSAESIYILGPAWRTLDIIEPLERDLGVPVVHHLPAQAWEIMKRLRVHEPKDGLGRLLREMP